MRGQGLAKPRRRRRQPSDPYARLLPSDGLAVTVAAVVDGTPRLFAVPVDGGAPRPFLAEQSVDPAWSPA